MSASTTKKSSVAVKQPRKPLSERPLDKLWFTFFLLVLALTAKPTTLLIDLQYLYPADLVPEILKKVLAFWVDTSGDPLIKGLLSGTKEWAWFKTFIMIEGFFQLPVFIVGAWALYMNLKGVYPLLLIYGASTTTTLIPCLAHLLSDVHQPALTSTQLLMLLSSYLPFLFIPLGITVDMAIRLGRAVQTAERIKRE